MLPDEIDRANEVIRVNQIRAARRDDQVIVGDVERLRRAGHRDDIQAGVGARRGTDGAAP